MKVARPSPRKTAILVSSGLHPLREVANTGPYFHDGSVATLEEAVKIMAQGGKPNDNLSV